MTGLISVPTLQRFAAVATVRERSPGVWEVRVLAGRAEDGRARPISRTVRGSRRAALKVAAELETDVPSPEGNRTVAELVHLWLELNQERWAPLSRRNYESRAALLAAGPMGRIKVGALRVEDVDRWILRLRRNGAGPGTIRNQLTVVAGRADPGGQVGLDRPQSRRLGRAGAVGRRGTGGHAG